ncbi:hypothetical protein [Flexithrix dorotheae]|uniref:hypothetical protein n=1 Tax=Flexithrix dorotheae TaxID=70993 RepID=UPI0003618962|nr:hypothetical protein [Flexithrix dorotheae]
MIDKDKALFWGEFFLKVIPVFLPLPLILIFGFFLKGNTLLILFLSIGISYLWRFAFSPLWEIWVYKRVIEPDQLKQDALESQLIWEKERIYNSIDLFFERLIEHIENRQTKKKETSISKSVRRNTKIQSYGHLMGFSFCMVVFLVGKSTKNEDIVRTKDLIKISAVLSSKPEYHSSKNSRYYSFNIKGCAKQFRIENFFCDALCKEKFTRDAIVNRKIEVFLSKQGLENINKGNCMINSKSVNQIAIDGKMYIDLDLRNKLTKAESKLIYILLPIGIISFLFAFCKKYRLNSLILIVIIMFFSVYFYFQETKEIFKNSNKAEFCSKL